MRSKERCPECGKRDYRGPVAHGLTSMQWQVAERIYEGLRYKEIADRLNISERTVRAHAFGIHRAWGVHSKTQVLLRMGQIKRMESEVTGKPA